MNDVCPYLFYPHFSLPLKIIDTQSLVNDQDTEEGCEDPSKEDEENASGPPQREPTPWQQLDVKTLKVTDLREELEARGLNSKGLKSQLVGR